MPAYPEVDLGNLRAVVASEAPDMKVVTVAWTDSQRGVTNGMYGPTLSCWGKNITDQKLSSKDALHQLPYIRSENLDEKLGVADTDDILCGMGGLTLTDVIENFMSHAKYRQLDSITMGHHCKRQKVVVGFQSAIVPIWPDQTREVAPTNYSYQTKDARNPCNLLILATPTGIYVSADGVGTTPLLAHEVHGTNVTQHYFKVSKTDCEAGAEQTAEVGSKRPSECVDKRVAKVVHLGLKGSGPKNNRMLVITVPLKQTEPPPSPRGDSVGMTYRSLSDNTLSSEYAVFRSCGSVPEVGKCHAARLDVGVESGEAVSMKGMDLVQDPDQPIRCTQIDYNVLVANEKSSVTISHQAAKAIVDEISDQYKLCDHVCKLSELPACLHKLEKKHMDVIAETLSTVKDSFVPNKNALSLFA